MFNSKIPEMPGTIPMPPIIIETESDLVGHVLKKLLELSETLDAKIGLDIEIGDKEYSFTVRKRCPGGVDL